MQNLWPDDLDTNEINEPLSIIDEQAQFLGQKTKNIVTARLSSTLSHADEGHFFYLFYLVAPILKGYRYRLFSFAQGIKPYPLYFYTDGELLGEIAPELQQKGVIIRNINRKPIKAIDLLLALAGQSSEDASSVEILARDKQELLDVLKLIFQSNTTKQIVNTLIVQSRYADPQVGFEGNEAA